MSGNVVLTPEEQLSVIGAINTFTDWHGWEIVRRVRNGEDVDYYVRRLGETESRSYAYFDDAGRAYFYVLKLIGGAGNHNTDAGREALEGNE